MKNESLTKERILQLGNIEEKTGYKFNDVSYLDRALTHSSYRNHSDHITEYRNINECLEFLGDSILDFTISEYLYKLYSDWHEGKLSKFRAKIVCEQSLYIVAKKLELWKYILVGRGEDATENMNPSIMADAVEAFIAGVYLDGGMDEAKKLVMSLLSENIDAIKNKKMLRDSKTDLQEIIQQTHGNPVQYVLIDRVGPQHDSVFTVEAVLDGKVIGTGKGKSKKEAEQQAASQAIDNIEAQGSGKGKK